MDERAYPLHWPAEIARTLARRSHPQFAKPSYNKGVDDIRRELRLMGVRTFVVSTNLRLNLSGLPYSNQRQPEDPGVALYFRRRNRDLVLTCDKWSDPGYNLRAITLTLEAMRGMQRWGCSEFLDRAFRGFEALPERASETAARAWYEVLEVEPDATWEEIRAAYHAKVRETHPDNGGSAAQFHVVCAAYREGTAARSLTG